MKIKEVRQLDDYSSIVVLLEVLEDLPLLSRLIIEGKEYRAFGWERDDSHNILVEPAVNAEAGAEVEFVWFKWNMSRNLSE